MNKKVEMLASLNPLNQVYVFNFGVLFLFGWNISVLIP